VGSFFVPAFELWETCLLRSVQRHIIGDRYCRPVPRISSGVIDGTPFQS